MCVRVMVTINYSGAILNIAGCPGEATLTKMMPCLEVKMRLIIIMFTLFTFIEGYHDAGDFVKFGFPMASTITVLAWGGISFKVKRLVACLSPDDHISPHRMVMRQPG